MVTALVALRVFMITGKVNVRILCLGDRLELLLGVFREKMSLKITYTSQIS